MRTLPDNEGGVAPGARHGPYFCDAGRLTNPSIRGQKASAKPLERGRLAFQPADFSLHRRDQPGRWRIPADPTEFVLQVLFGLRGDRPHRLFSLKGSDKLSGDAHGLTIGQMGVSARGGWSTCVDSRNAISPSQPRSAGVKSAWPGSIEVIDDPLRDLGPAIGDRDPPPYPA